MPSNKKRQIGAGEQVLDFLLSHRNQVVTVTQVVNATGLTERQVQYTVNNLRRTKGDYFTIEPVLQGRSWALRDVPETPPPSSSGKRIFEEIGPAKDGSLVVQDGDGKLYKAIEL